MPPSKRTEPVPFVDRLMPSEVSVTRPLMSTVPPSRLVTSTERAAAPEVVSVASMVTLPLLSSTSRARVVAVIAPPLTVNVAGSGDVGQQDAVGGAGWPLLTVLSVNPAVADGDAVEVDAGAGEAGDLIGGVGGGDRAATAGRERGDRGAAAGRLIAPGEVDVGTGVAGQGDSRRWRPLPVTGPLNVTVPLERLATLTALPVLPVIVGGDGDVAAGGTGEREAGGVALDQRVGTDRRRGDRRAGDATVVLAVPVTPALTRWMSTPLANVIPTPPTALLNTFGLVVPVAATSVVDGGCPRRGRRGRR